MNHQRLGKAYPTKRKVSGSKVLLPAGVKYRKIVVCLVLKERGMANTLAEEWENGSANEKSLERHLKEGFPDFQFKVTWKPFNISVTAPGDRELTKVEVKNIQDSVEYWHQCAFGTGIVWGTPIRS